MNVLMIYFLLTYIFLFPLLLICCSYQRMLNCQNLGVSEYNLIETRLMYDTNVHEMPIFINCICILNF